MLKKAIIFSTAAILLRIIIITKGFDASHFSLLCHRQNGILVPMPGSCNGFYICVNGEAVPTTCGNYHLFNPYTGACDYPGNVDCNVKEVVSNSSTTATTATTTTTTATTTLTSTPKTTTIVDFIANTLIPHPKYPDEALPDDKVGAICYNKTDGTRISINDSCARFYICIKQRPYKRTCPTKLNFNSQLGLCQDPVFAKCKNLRVEPLKNANNKNVCKNVTNGTLLANKGFCNSFIRCQQQKMLVFKCGKNLEFSAQQKRCLLPKLANCTKYKL